MKKNCNAALRVVSVGIDRKVKFVQSPIEGGPAYLQDLGNLTDIFIILDQALHNHIDQCRYLFLSRRQRALAGRHRRREI
jgi:hypothetical protein